MVKILLQIPLSGLDCIVYLPSIIGKTCIQQKSCCSKSRKLHFVKTVWKHGLTVIHIINKRMMT